MFTITTLMQAARAARIASTNGRVVTIAVCEEGFVVAGSKDGSHAAIDIWWHDIDVNDELLANAVRLIERGLP